MIEIFDITVFAMKSNTWYESPVIATLLGFFLSFFVNILNIHFKEKKELQHYEYLLLKETKEILELNITDKTNRIDNFLGRFYNDLRFTKLRSMRLIRDSLDKSKNNDPCVGEINAIDMRLRELSREGNLQKIANEIKKIKSWFI